MIRLALRQQAVDQKVYDDERGASDQVWRFDLAKEGTHRIENC